MAKTKKDINAFQKAMLSNTKVIGNADKKKEQSASNQRSVKNNSQQGNSELISQELVNKYEIFAKELNIKPNDAIKLALNHFLDLKDFMKDYK